MPGSNFSFRAFVLSAIALGICANAAPGSPQQPDTPSSPISDYSIANSAISTSSGYSIKTVNGKECIANSGSRDRFTDPDFLSLFPEFKSPSNNRRASGDEGSVEPEEGSFQFDTEDRPEPTEEITLFHGTAPRFARSLYNGVQIFKNRGDLSASGGFYLTNSLRAAAQWGCHGRRENATETVVFEYKWNPTKGSLKIRSYADWTTKAEYRAFCAYNNCSDEIAVSKEMQKKVKALVKQDHDMIAGPMMPVGGDITPGFYQYAILKEAIAKPPFLTRVAYHSLKCDKFQPGEITTRDTQGPVDQFTKEEKDDIGWTQDESYKSRAPPRSWANDDAGKVDLAARPDAKKE